MKRTVIGLTVFENIELDALCNAMESGQDFGPDRATHEPSLQAVSAVPVGVTGKGEVK